MAPRVKDSVGEAAKRLSIVLRRSFFKQIRYNEPMEGRTCEDCAGNPSRFESIIKSLHKKRRLDAFFFLMAPRVGLEPTTLRLTAECSAIELPRNNSEVFQNLVELL